MNFAENGGGGGGKCSQNSSRSVNSNSDTSNSTKSYLEICKERLQNLWAKIPELPFSNIYLAYKSHHLIPQNSVVHLGILHSICSWNFFDFSQGARAYSNVGGFGIDGCVSATLGASLADKNNLVFCIVGDLAFFYDMNALGNRHIAPNLRILLVNNGKGTEFRLSEHIAVGFGDSCDEFTAAGGHFGNQSPTLVREYALNLGFTYLSASDKKKSMKVSQRNFSVLK